MRAFRHYNQYLAKMQLPMHRFRHGGCLGGFFLRIDIVKQVSAKHIRLGQGQIALNTLATTTYGSKSAASQRVNRGHMYLNGDLASSTVNGKLTGDERHSKEREADFKRFSRQPTWQNATFADCPKFALPLRGRARPCALGHSDRAVLSQKEVRGGYHRVESQFRSRHSSQRLLRDDWMGPARNGTAGFR